MKNNLTENQKKILEDVKKFKEEQGLDILPGLNLLSKKYSEGKLARRIAKYFDGWHDFRLQLGEPEDKISLKPARTDKQWAERFNQFNEIIDENSLLTNYDFLNNKILVSILQSKLFKRSTRLIRDVYNLPQYYGAERKQLEFEKNIKLDPNLDYRISESLILKDKRKKQTIDNLYHAIYQMLNPNQIYVLNQLRLGGQTRTSVGKSIDKSRAYCLSVVNEVSKKIKDNKTLQRMFLDILN